MHRKHKQNHEITSNTMAMYHELLDIQFLDKSLTQSLVENDEEKYAHPFLIEGIIKLNKVSFAAGYRYGSYSLGQ